MDGIGLILLATLVVGIGILLHQRYRRRLRITNHDIRCPLDDRRAEIAVHTDPRAQSCRQYVDVASCSLLSGVAIALPERTTYLWDGPPWRVCVDPARSFPVYATEVSCRQPCVFVLNAAAVFSAPGALTCASGVSDAIGLAHQAIDNPRISRLLWYASC